jgi:succinoglycan biosynthesis protein ExoA
MATSFAGTDVRADAGEPLPRVSIVVPIRNEARYIARSLRSILAQNYPRDLMEILVADGMSDDGTREHVREIQAHDSRVRMVDNPSRIVATGLNTALPQTSGVVIVRVDGHCEIDPDYVRCAVAHLADASIAAVGGPLRTIGETQMARTIAAAMSSRFGVGDSTFRVGGAALQDVDTVAFPGYARAALRRAGPFDDELVRNQDDEYSYRLRSLGYRVVFAPDMRATYYSRGTLRSLWRQYFQYGYWKVRVMQKHPRQMRARQFAPPLFVAALLTAMLAAVTSNWGGRALLAVVGPYAVVSLLAAAAVATGTTWRAFPLLPLTFAVLHVSYGSGFLIGLARFAFRWAAANEATAARADAMTQRAAWL